MDSLLQNFSIYLSQIILIEQQATEGNEITNDSINSFLDPTQNEPKLRTLTSAKSITSQVVIVSVILILSLHAPYLLFTKFIYFFH